MPPLFKTILFSLIFILGLTPGSTALAQASLSDLQSQIRDRNSKIEALEKEIAAYQKNISTTQAQASTLKGEMARLDAALKKLNADVRLTQAEIERAELTLKKLGLEIGRKSQGIEAQVAALAFSLRRHRELTQASFLELALADESLNALWSEEGKLEKLQGGIVTTMDELRTAKADLEDQHQATEKEQKKLLALKAQLADQQKIENNNKKEKSALLAATQNQEANYKKLLADRQAQKAAFERELFAFESQLKLAVDPAKIPNRGKIFSWPLDNVFITQYFGRTVDAARLYVSGTHNGIDLRAADGTPVKAAGSGIVTATGNTDEQVGCYSYGRWVLLRHPNGLSTLYAHLSLTKVATGQAITAGQLIGYSGRTGYATGPHLHFSVYASEGVRVQRYVTSINCQNVTIPMADPKAYLDPLLYL